jgi:MFS family permease
MWGEQLLMGPQAMESGKVEQARIRSYRAAVGTIFLLLGCVFGSWVSRIPAVQERTGVSTGLLSIALVAGSLSGIAAMNVAGRLAERHGSRVLTRVSVAVLCFSLPLPGLATTFAELAAALIAFSVGVGLMEVSVNAEALRLEHMGERRIMSSLHGLFSVGGMAGAAGGGWAAAHGMAPFTHLTIAAGVLLAVGVVFGFRLPPDGPREPQQRPRERIRFRLPHPALAGLGVVALCGLIAEGAMGDWTALYLVRMLKTSPGTAALGFAAFSMCMAGARLLGDIAAHRLGAVNAVRGGGILSALSIAVALAAVQPWLAIAAFGLSGIGIAVIVPLAYSAAGDVPGVAPSRAIASVATVGSFGFLIGPPLIGFMAEFTNLRIALALLIPLCVVIAILAGRVDVKGRT